ncbi:MAG: transcriptional repressor [Deltaproteobacteria bacterium]|nr:transcriptional repressor [Deltaproteobacteria bacterium]
MKKSVMEKMREKGMKLTPQRRAILEFLVRKGTSHPGARVIHEHLRKKLKSLSLSTVYLTLKELERHGLIRILEFDRRDNRCETNLDMHVNLICKRCHQIKDLPFLPLDPREVLKKAGFQVSDTRVEYYGLCERCRRQGRYHV